MTGIGTVLADDPSLNVRAPEIDTQGLQPLRVVLDSRLRMPVDGGNVVTAGDRRLFAAPVIMMRRALRTPALRCVISARTARS